MKINFNWQKEARKMRNEIKLVWISKKKLESNINLLPEQKVKRW